MLPKISGYSLSSESSFSIVCPHCENVNEIKVVGEDFNSTDAQHLVHDYSVTVLSESSLGYFVIIGIKVSISNIVVVI